MAGTLVCGSLEREERCLTLSEAGEAAPAGVAWVVSMLRRRGAPRTAVWRVRCVVRRYRATVWGIGACEIKYGFTRVYRQPIVSYRPLQ